MKEHVVSYQKFLQKEYYNMMVVSANEYKNRMSIEGMEIGAFLFISQYFERRQSVMRATTLKSSTTEQCVAANEPQSPLISLFKMAVLVLDNQSQIYKEFMDHREILLSMGNMAFSKNNQQSSSHFNENLKNKMQGSLVSSFQTQIDTSCGTEPQNFTNELVSFGPESGDGSKVNILNDAIESLERRNNDLLCERETVEREVREVSLENCLLRAKLEKMTLLLSYHLDRYSDGNEDRHTLEMDQKGFMDNSSKSQQHIEESEKSLTEVGSNATTSTSSLCSKYSDNVDRDNMVMNTNSDGALQTSEEGSMPDVSALLLHKHSHSWDVSGEWSDIDPECNSGNLKRKSKKNISSIPIKPLHHAKCDGGMNLTASEYPRKDGITVKALASYLSSKAQHFIPVCQKSTANVDNSPSLRRTRGTIINKNYGKETMKGALEMWDEGVCKWRQRVIRLDIVAGKLVDEGDAPVVGGFSNSCPTGRSTPVARHCSTYNAALTHSQAEAPNRIQSDSLYYSTKQQLLLLSTSLSDIGNLAVRSPALRLCLYEDIIRVLDAERTDEREVGAKDIGRLADTVVNMYVSGSESGVDNGILPSCAANNRSIGSIGVLRAYFNFYAAIGVADVLKRQLDLDNTDVASGVWGKHFYISCTVTLKSSMNRSVTKTNPILSTNGDVNDESVSPEKLKGQNGHYKTRTVVLIEQFRCTSAAVALRWVRALLDSFP